MPATPEPRLRRLFLTGLLTLMPVWLTWVVVKFVFSMLSDIGRPLVEPVLTGFAAGDPTRAWLAQPWVMAALALLATILAILVVGWLARRVFGQRLIHWFEALVARVPLANTVYGSARQLLDILQTQPDGAQRVVLIEFPHPGVKTVGFVTRTYHDAGSGKELAAVYVPTTPNPTGGYLQLVPVDELVSTDWSVDEAMRFIISGGAVSPGPIPFTPPDTRP